MPRRIYGISSCNGMVFIDAIGMPNGWLDHCNPVNSQKVVETILQDTIIDYHK